VERCAASQLNSSSQAAVGKMFWRWSIAMRDRSPINLAYLATVLVNRNGGWVPI
jgi:hypothetical protein